jgi:hypothetical protein
MFLGKKSDKKGHPYIILTGGALAAVGVFAIKSCSMNFIKSKFRGMGKTLTKMKNEACDACEQMMNM